MKLNFYRLEIVCVGGVRCCFDEGYMFLNDNHIELAVHQNKDQEDKNTVFMLNNVLYYTITESEVKIPTAEDILDGTR